MLRLVSVYHDALSTQAKNVYKTQIVICPRFNTLVLTIKLVICPQHQRNTFVHKHTVHFAVLFTVEHAEQQFGTAHSIPPQSTTNASNKSAGS